MGQETKRRGRDEGAGRASRPRKVSVGDSSPHGSGGMAPILNATHSQSLNNPPAETQSTAAAARALARWENEGGRVLAADQRRRG